MKEEDGRQTLVIKGLKLADAGEFTCKIGDRETSAKLQVDEGEFTKQPTYTFLEINIARKYFI